MAEWSRILLPMQETQETWARSLGQEEPLEKEMATYSTIFDPMDRKAWRLPSPVFVPGKFHGQWSPAGNSSWGRKESGMTEQLTQHHKINKLIFLKVTFKESVLDSRRFYYLYFLIISSC